MPDNTVFLFDVDNTLLDNDAVAADLRAHLTEHFGDERQQFRLAYPHETRMLEMSEWLLEYPFAERVYPKELEVVGQTRAHGRPVTDLSDGDVVFQPRKRHYAHDAEQLARYPAPDVTVERIADVPGLVGEPWVPARD